MNKLLKIGAAALLSIATLAGCASGSKEENSEKPTEVLIGISPDYMPYEGLDSKGQLEGFDIDMTKWLFDYLNENGRNYTYEFKELSFDTIITALQSGQIDLGISGFTYDEEREGIFSDSYYDSAQVIVVDKDSDIQSSADLNGKLVGAQHGATGEDVANGIEGAKVQAMQDVKVLMESLKAQGLDAVVIDQAVADNYAANGDYKVLDEKMLDEENIIYSTEDHQDLMDDVNEAIKAFKDSGEYKELVDKWFAASGEASVHCCGRCMPISWTSPSYGPDAAPRGWYSPPRRCRRSSGGASAERSQDGSWATTASKPTQHRPARCKTAYAP